MSVDSFAQNNIYNELKKSVYSEWITANPKFNKTKPSYFNNVNSEKYFVAPLQISGLNVPFTWDSDLSILKFLTTKDTNFSVKKGVNADKIFQGTKIQWTKPESALIWIQENTYKSAIANWYLFGANDCPGTHLFPLINFEKIFELENARVNRLRGIVIIPFNEEIKKITSSKIELTTVDGSKLKGTGYDINNDNILDVFSYYESLGDEGMTGYRRLYLNINGIWTSKWSEYYEECI